MESAILSISLILSYSSFSLCLVDKYLCGPLVGLYEPPLHTLFIISPKLPECPLDPQQVQSDYKLPSSLDWRRALSRGIRRAPCCPQRVHPKQVQIQFKFGLDSFVFYPHRLMRH